MKKITSLIAATTIAFAFTAAPAMAGPDKKNGKVHSQSMKEKGHKAKKKGHDMKERGQEMRDQHSGMKDKELRNERAQENRDGAYDRYEDGRERHEDAREMHEDSKELRMERRDDAWERRDERRDGFEGGRGNAQSSDGRLTDKAMPSQAIQNSRRAATVNCPFGTTAQPNGTCLVTGDYKW